MRDSLTVLAGILILILAAALIAPPFIDWDARRDLIERAIAEATGAPAETRGRISVRLLPSPRLQLDELHLGSDSPDHATLAARQVSAEIALTPLLGGRVSFTEARIGRAEVRVPSLSGGWRLPGEIGRQVLGDWTIEDLFLDELLVTVQSPQTGRTDQILATDTHLTSPSLAGPWRMDGLSRGVPFRISTGTIAPGRAVPVRFAGGAEGTPQFDIDARVTLDAEGGAPRASASGTVRLAFGPPPVGGQAQPSPSAELPVPPPIPLSLQASFDLKDGVFALDPVTVEAGEGGGILRLAGTGELDPTEPRLRLTLEGRRLDLDGVMAMPGGDRIVPWLMGAVQGGLPLGLQATLDSVTLGGEEVRNLALAAGTSRGRIALERLEATLPGETRFSLAGTLHREAQGEAIGHIRLVSSASDRLAGWLTRLGLAERLLSPLDGRPLDAEADITIAPPVASLRNARIAIGDTVLTGSARYAAAEAGARASLDAQLAVRGLDLAALPRLSETWKAAGDLDIGLFIDARGVRYAGAPGAGRIAARIRSEGAELVVDTLEIVDLAGANAQVSGRLGPDGGGRIAGRVTARRAAPLVDLLGQVWLGDATRFVPPFLREGALALDLVAERLANPDARRQPSLRTALTGTAAGGRFEAEILAVGTRADSFALTLATDRTGAWFSRPDAPSLRQPATLTLRGRRSADDRFAIELSGDAGGARLATVEPLTIGPEARLLAGALQVSSPDLGPYLPLIGIGAGVSGPMPAELRADVLRGNQASAVAVSGRVAESAVTARFVQPDIGDPKGTVTLDRLSLPWLANAFALGIPEDARASEGWSSARFGAVPQPAFTGEARIEVRQAALGRDLLANNAAFTLRLNPEGLAIREFRGEVAGGELTGEIGFTRQGGAVAVVGEGRLQGAPLRSLAGQTPIGGTLSAKLSFGASGGSPAQLVANLAGAGDLRLDGLEAPNADAAGIGRAIARALKEDDPLGANRLRGLVAEEVARGPFRASIPVNAPATMVGGAVRLSPFQAEGADGTWQGSVTFDFKSFVLDARGTLSARVSPQGWNGNPPFVALGWRGPLAAPLQDLDVGPLTNGVAAIVLQRELERIEAYEAEENERQRRAQHREFARERKVAEENARRAAEEAARQERLRQEEIARKAAEEATRLERQRREEEARRAAAEEAARKAAEETARKAAEEAARQERQRQEEAARRAAEEAARLERQRQEEAARRAAEEAARQERLRQERSPPAEGEAKRTSITTGEERLPSLQISPSGEPIIPPPLPSPTEIAPPPRVFRAPAQ